MPSSFLKNFEQTRLQKKQGAKNRDENSWIQKKNSWMFAKNGRSKQAFGGRFRYCQRRGYKKSLGGGSAPRGCKRGGGGRKRCRICHPPRKKKSIDIETDVFIAV